MAQTAADNGVSDEYGTTFGQFRRFERKDRCRQAVITKKELPTRLGRYSALSGRVSAGFGGIPFAMRSYTAAIASMNEVLRCQNSG